MNNVFFYVFYCGIYHLRVFVFVFVYWEFGELWNG